MKGPMLLLVQLYQVEKNSLAHKIIKDITFIITYITIHGRQNNALPKMSSINAWNMNMLGSKQSRIKVAN